jgi:hypothetical protein
MLTSLHLSGDNRTKNVDYYNGVLEQNMVKLLMENNFFVLTKYESIMSKK